jgi:hypothetical protein
MSGICWQLEARLDYGAIIFDDITLGKKEGWACKSPDFQPFRISVESIGNTAIWVTNASYEQFKALNIQNHVFLKIDAYLRANIHQILRTFGASAMSADMHAYCAANVFYNMVRYYYKFIAKPHAPGVTLDDLEVPLVDLRDGIREMYDMDSPVTPQNRLAIEKSVVDYVKCEAPFVRFSTETKSVGVWFPKLAHAKRILSQPVPLSADTKHVRVPRSGVNGRELVEESMQPDCPPRLFRVDLFEISHPDIAYLFSVGNGTLRRRRVSGRRMATSYSLRQWITHTDLALISQFADLNVREVVEFPKFGTLLDRPHNKAFFEDDEGPRRVGFSSGFFAEVLWMGATRPLIDVTNPEIRKNYINPMTPFLKAYDRMHCLSLAIEAKTSYDLDVSGYGIGKIMFMLPPEKFNDILDLCIERGLLTDLRSWSDEHSVDFMGGDQTISDLQNAMFYGSVSDLIDFDNAVTDLEFEG